MAVVRHITLLLTLLAVLAATPASADVLVRRAPDPEPPAHRVAPFLVDRSDVPTKRHGQFSVTYRVARLDVRRAGFRQFRRSVEATLRDPRGWGVDGAAAFRRVAADADFTLWLASPAAIAATGAGCSASYSCRVGDDVYINEMRWRKGADTYRALPLGHYRAYVVNHEVGHWLELDHRGCPEPGTPSPVMQQQSKGVRGCDARPWPLPGEQREALDNLEQLRG